MFSVLLILSLLLQLGHSLINGSSKHSDGIRNIRMMVQLLPSQYLIFLENSLPTLALSKPHLFFSRRCPTTASPHHDTWHALSPFSTSYAYIVDPHHSPKITTQISSNGSNLGRAPYTIFFPALSPYTNDDHGQTSQATQRAAQKDSAIRRAAHITSCQASNILCRRRRGVSEVSEEEEVFESLLPVEDGNPQTRKWHYACPNNVSWSTWSPF